MLIQLFRNIVVSALICATVFALHHYVGVGVLNDKPLGILGGIMVGVLSGLLTNRLLPYTF